MQLSQSIVRRRKEDTGEPLVERTYCPVRVPFGQRQREPHEKWLKGFERFFCETHPHSPLVEGGVVHPFAAALGQRCRSSSTPSRRRPGTRLDRDHRLELDPEDAQAARTLPGTRRGRRRGAGRLVPDRDRPHPRRAAAGAGRARRTHRRGARRPRPDQEPAQTRGRGVRVRGGRRRRALRPTRTLGARDASSAR